MQLSSFFKHLPTWRRGSPQREAFWELAEVHVSFLYNVAYKYSGNRFDAEDLVQEALTIAFKKFDQLRNIDKFRSWMFTILRNVYLKGKRHREPIEIDEYENGLDYVSRLENTADRMDVSRAYEKKVEAESVQSILNQLPEKYKTVLILYYMEDHSYQDISEILMIPIGTVMSRISRAKQAMKKALLSSRLRQSEEKHSKRTKIVR